MPNEASQRGDGDGLGATVFVVCGWVPAGEALGSGFTVLVGCGVSWSGVTVAVGRGPAGMLGLEIGVAVSAGGSASAEVAKAQIATKAVSWKKRLTITASGALLQADVIP